MYVWVCSSATGTILSETGSFNDFKLTKQAGLALAHKPLGMTTVHHHA